MTITPKMDIDLIRNANERMINGETPPQTFYSRILDKTINLEEFYDIPLDMDKVNKAWKQTLEQV